MRKIQMTEKICLIGNMSLNYYTSNNSLTDVKLTTVCSDVLECNVK